MKRTLLFFALICLLLSCTVTATAAADTANVSVSIADENGALVMARVSVSVTDVDNDGALTLHDALYAAHEANYNGGAEQGYATSVGAYGLSLNKLWGAANGSGFGYRINHASAMNLTDPIKDGDYVYAYVYTDTVTWSDTYCYFETERYEVSADDAVTLRLMASGYDANFAPIEYAVQGANILINGVETEYITDENGSVTIPFTDSGLYLISAKSATAVLTPPACTVLVTGEETEEQTTEQESTVASTATEAYTATDLQENKGCGSMLSFALLPVAFVIPAVILRKKHD